MEKIEKDDGDNAGASLSEKHYADFEPSGMPIAPDGGMVPGFALEPPAPLPELTPQNFVCLRGPCRHYWHLVTDVDMENPESTWDALGISKPRQHHHTCLVNPGTESNLNGDHVHECSKWDPFAIHELVQLKARRQAYFDTNPDPTPEEQIDEPDESA